MARQVKANHPHVAIVIVSGRLAPQPGDLPEGGHFLPKPVPPDTLVERVRALIQGNNIQGK